MTGFPRQGQLARKETIQPRKRSKNRNRSRSRDKTTRTHCPPTITKLRPHSRTCRIPASGRRCQQWLLLLVLLEEKGRKEYGLHQVAAIAWLGPAPHNALSSVHTTVNMTLGPTLSYLNSTIILCLPQFPAWSRKSAVKATRLSKTDLKLHRNLSPTPTWSLSNSVLPRMMLPRTTRRTSSLIPHQASV